MIEELARTELFRNVPNDILDSVQAHNKLIELLPGELLLSPDQDNQYIYLLLSGRLSLHFGSIESPEIRVLERGASVGEMSVIDQSPPSAFVVAKEVSRVFPVHRDQLQALIADSNPVVRNLLRILSQWIRANTECIVKDRSRIGELNDHATTDALTGLYNRRWLNNALERFIEQTKENQQSLCVLLMDVDFFKRYNDTLGHLAGDQALIAIGKCLQSTMRPFDFATRFGGEEFLILLPDTTLNEGIVVAERIRLTIENHPIDSLEGAVLPSVTLSIGLVATTPDSTSKSLIEGADTKLYQAKQDGRNCVRY